MRTITNNACARTRRRTANHIAAMVLAGALVSCGGGEQEDPAPPPGGGGFPAPSAAAITTPSSGDTVSGSVDVTANATAEAGVAGVQFQLDDTDLGGEDTAEPYSVIWDSTAAGNGMHRLTAIARDAGGNTVTSAPVAVTVSNGAVVRYEEPVASLVYSPGWVPAPSGWFAWSGGTARQAVAAGARATFFFTGTSVTWVGYRDGSSGIARVYLDGVAVSDVDLFARTFEVHTTAFTLSGLSAASHTLAIEVTGLKNPDSLSNVVVVDAFDVEAPVVSHLQETDPDITYTAGWQQADSDIAWSGGGAATLPDPPLGGAKASATAGARATLSFNGTSISWSGARRASTGIARVYIDGIFVREVDTYATTDKIQDTVFTATGLADADHTLAIEATGRKNPASTAALVVVDAFDVTTPGRRFEEVHGSIAYSGDWTQGNRNRPWSEGTSAVSSTAGSQATFSFNGTSVRWIGFRAARTGIARVYLDGAFVIEIDTYALIEGFQNTVFSAAGLADTSHTLTIEATGRRNPAAVNNYVVVDAFDVRR